MTTNLSPLPVWLSVFFIELEYGAAKLRISANNDPTLTINVSHENIETFAISGNAEITDLLVADGDTLLIAAYNKDNEVIAGGLYEVSNVLIGKLGAVLDPIYESRLLVDQMAQKIVDRAAVRALKTISDVRTGELVVAGEAAR